MDGDAGAVGDRWLGELTRLRGIASLVIERANLDGGGMFHNRMERCGHHARTQLLPASGVPVKSIAAKSRSYRDSSLPTIRMLL